MRSWEGGDNNRPLLGSRGTSVAGMVSGESGKESAPLEGAQWDYIGWHDYMPDRGCQLNPSCLTCPHPLCVEDVGADAARAAAIEAGTMKRRRNGRSNPETRKWLGKSVVPAWVEHLDDIKQHLVDGKTFPETASATGLPYHAVYDAAGYLGIKPPSSKYPPEVRAKVVELRGAGETFRAIGAQLGIPHPTVQSIYRKAAA